MDQMEARRRHFYGVLRAPQEITITSPEALKAAQIAYIGITASDIYVSDVGALNNAVITYEVRDSLGNASCRFTKIWCNFLYQLLPE
jgi:hypothetical protein